MLIIKKDASQKLIRILSENLRITTSYGSPPIFYWYRNMIEETKKIEGCRYLRRGEYKYQLGYSLGIAYVKCEYVGKTRFLIITDYDINTNVLFSWGTQHGDSGIIQTSKSLKSRKPFKRLTTKPLFGYSYVMNDRNEYNLIDNNGNLITDWFKAIKPLQQPYGQYQIIAYINVGGWLCALGYNGKVYNLKRTWREAYMENIQILPNRDILVESYNRPR